MSRGIGMRLIRQRHRTVALDRNTVATNSSRGGGDGSSKPRGRTLSLSFNFSGRVTNSCFFCLCIVSFACLSVALDRWPVSHCCVFPLLALLVSQLLGTGDQSFILASPLLPLTIPTFLPHLSLFLPCSLASLHLARASLIKRRSCFSRSRLGLDARSLFSLTACSSLLSVKQHVIVS